MVAYEVYMRGTRWATLQDGVLPERHGSDVVSLQFYAVPQIYGEEFAIRSLLCRLRDGEATVLVHCDPGAIDFVVSREIPDS